MRFLPDLKAREESRYRTHPLRNPYFAHIPAQPPHVCGLEMDDPESLVPPGASATTGGGEFRRRRPPWRRTDAAPGLDLTGRIALVTVATTLGPPGAVTE